MKIIEAAVDGDGNATFVNKGVRKQRAYVAGPMRAIRHFNFPAFFAAQGYLESEGFEVFNPAEKDLARGFDPVSLDMTGYEDVTVDKFGMDIRSVLKEDLEFITELADLVVVLDGWRKSKGAISEVATARAIGIPVQDLDGNVVTDSIQAVAQ